MCGEWGKQEHIVQLIVKIQDFWCPELFFWIISEEISLGVADNCVSMKLSVLLNFRFLNLPFDVV